MAQDSDGIAAWARMLRVHAAVVPKLERLVAAASLQLTWYDVLLVLNAAPERRLTMSDLGLQAVVSRERVSRVVQELVQAGMVSRTPNPDDKRSYFAQITPEGRKRLKQVAPVYLAGVEAHFLTHLTKAEVASISAALDKVMVAEETRRPSGGGQSGVAHAP